MAPAGPGAFFSFAAFVLLLLCSLSTPLIKQIYFLRADVVGEVLTASVSGEARFGTFGWCTSAIGVNSTTFGIATSVAAQCSEKSLGYTFNPSVLGVDITTGTNYDRIFTALTKVLVLVPVGCGLAFVVFVCSVFSMTCNSRVWEVMAFLWSILALLVTWVGWIVEIVGFSIAKNRLKSYTDDALEGTFGNALWMHLAAAVVLLLTTCLTCFGMCGAYRERRRARAGAYAPPSTGHYGGNAGWSGRFFKRKTQGSTY